MKMERGAWDYFHRIDALGGMVAAIERGYPQREIAEAAYKYQLAVDRKEKIIVGVNDYVAEEKRSTFCRLTRPSRRARPRSCANCGRSARTPKSSVVWLLCAKPRQAKRT